MRRLVLIANGGRRSINRVHGSFPSHYVCLRPSPQQPDQFRQPQTELLCTLGKRTLHFSTTGKDVYLSTLLRSKSVPPSTMGSRGHSSSPTDRSLSRHNSSPVNADDPPQNVRVSRRKPLASRRRGRTAVQNISGGEETSNRRTNEDAVISKIQQLKGLKQADATLKQIHAGVKDMVGDRNPGMAVQWDDGSPDTTVIIQLSPDVGGGEYKIGYERSVGELTMYSPADTKTRSYKYDDNYEAWLSTEDGHQLLEILMRQLTGRCNGYPKF